MKKKYNWEEIQKHYDSGLTQREIQKKFGVSFHSFSKASKRGDFKSRSASSAMKLAAKKNPNSWKMTDEVKAKISKSMKKFIAENPDKVPYLQNHHSKGESYPEKYFADCFNGKFQKAFRILNYTLDFADIENKIDIEIGGEQHFVDKRIVKHDKQRNKTLQELGWSIIRVRWSMFQKLSKCRKEKVIKSILENIDYGFKCCLFLDKNPNEEKIKEFYEKAKIKFNKKPCPKCGKEIWSTSNFCLECSNKNKTKLNFLTKEYLEELLIKNNVAQIARDLKVSHTKIHKLIKKYKIKR